MTAHSAERGGAAHGYSLTDTPGLYHGDNERRANGTGDIGGAVK